MGNPEREPVSKDARAVTPGRNSKERPRSRSRTSRRGGRRASVGDAGARRERHAGRAPSEAGVMCRVDVPEEAGAGRSAARRRARGAALDGTRPPGPEAGCRRSRVGGGAAPPARPASQPRVTTSTNRSVAQTDSTHRFSTFLPF